MTKNTFARPPLSEANRARSYRYGVELFEKPDDCDAEPQTYYYALEDSKKLVFLHHPSAPEDAWVRLRTLLVHECEQSRAWMALWDSKDDPQRAFDEWHSLSRDALIPLIARLSELSKLDGRYGYDVRNCFYGSAQIAMSPTQPSEAWLPNINIENNGFSFPTGGPVAQQVELQLLSRLFLGRFPDWLASLNTEIVTLHSGFEIGRRIGPMWIEPPVSRLQILSRSGKQLATLALVARLQAIFRRVTSRTHPTIPSNLESICGEIPDSGKPCWGIIVAFVNATFQMEIDKKVLEQRWSTFRNRRSIQLADWPDAIERQESAANK